MAQSPGLCPGSSGATSHQSPAFSNRSLSQPSAPELHRGRRGAAIEVVFLVSRFLMTFHFTARCCSRSVIENNEVSWKQRVSSHTTHLHFKQTRINQCVLRLIILLEMSYHDCQLLTYTSILFLIILLLSLNVLLKMIHDVVNSYILLQL